MKILYLSTFRHRWSTEQYVVHALQQHDVDVMRCKFDKATSLVDLQQRIDQESPDFVLFAKPSLPCFHELVKWCKSQNLTTVSWLWDLYWGFRRQRPPQFWCDYVFTTDGGHDTEFRSIGANHSLLRQGIHLPEAQLFNRVDHVWDVAFVGANHTYRGRTDLLAWLRDTYGDGLKWIHSTRGLNLNKQLAKCKIIVGDSYPSPNYWSNRIYEIAGRGGFLLHPEVEGLSEEFADGYHYRSFRHGDFEQLQTLIEYYLTHDDKREIIRRQGHAHCKSHYTYTQRVKHLLTNIGAI